MLQALRALLWTAAVSVAGVAVGGMWLLITWLGGGWAGFVTVGLVVFAFWYFGDRPGLIRQRRRAHGQCEHCGYDLRGNVTAVCPECGSPFEPSARATAEPAVITPANLATPAYTTINSR